MVMSWARSILIISKKAWTFPARHYYYKSSFSKINRKPNSSKTEGRKGHTGPLGQPWGEELPCRFLSRPGGSQHYAFTKITHTQSFPNTSSEQPLGGIWAAVSWAAVLNLPQIKLNLTLTLSICFNCQTILFWGKYSRNTSTHGEVEF